MSKSESSVLMLDGSVEEACISHKWGKTEYGDWVDSLLAGTAKASIAKSQAVLGHHDKGKIEGPPDSQSSGGTFSSSMMGEWSSSPRVKMQTFVV